METEKPRSQRRRDTAAALRENEARFRTLLDSTAQAIYGVDTRGICTIVNTSCARMLGYRSKDDLIGRELHSLIHHTHPGGRPYPLDQCPVHHSVLDGKSAHIDGEVFWRADGSSFPVEYWAHPLYHSGRLAGTVVTFVDITERKRAEAALRLSEERYRLISSVTTDLLYSCVRSGEGQDFEIEWAAGSAENLFGYSVGEIIERHCLRCLVHPDDLPVFDDKITRLVPGQSSACELRVIHRDGAVRDVRAYSKVVEGGEGRPAHHLFGACEDITERKRAQRQLEESERRLGYALSAAGEGIWDWDLRTNKVLHNAQWCRLLGFDDQVLTHPLDEYKALVHEDDRGEFVTALERCLGDEGPFHSKHRLKRRDGDVIWVLDRGDVVERDADGRPLRMVGSFTDITQQHENLHRIAFLAHHDVLTSLPNRLLARDRFEQAMSRSVRGASKAALLFLDLDHFKTINDSLGHQVGDRLLQQVVRRISTKMRASDTISRQGGDEFLVILADIADERAANAVAQHIIADLAHPFQVDGHLLHTSFSIGISVFPDDGSDFDTLLRKADTAMYTAKEAGRNTYRFFTEEMNRQAFERLRLQSRLRNALAENELVLNYQPQVELPSGRLIGFEALLRWRTGEFGLISPSRFIPVAEDSGLILSIGEWALRKACRQARAWQDSLGIQAPVAVNISALQFRRGDLVKTVADALSQSGLDPRLLELELTEGILLQDLDAAMQTLRQLGKLGVSMAIDDFGTGYSSLSYLKRLPLDRLKIDRSFVHDMINDPDDAAIVKAIIQMAHSLEFRVIGEGVEDAEQAAWLLHEGCQQAQGYHFGHPMSAEAVGAHVAANKKK